MLAHRSSLQTELAQVRNAGEMVEGKRDASRRELATVDAEFRQARSLEHQSSQQHESWHNTVQQALNDLHLQNAEAQTRLREELLRSLDSCSWNVCVLQSLPRL